MYIGRALWICFGSRAGKRDVGLPFILVFKKKISKNQARLRALAGLMEGQMKA
jgi:hypothetical protein